MYQAFCRAQRPELSRVVGSSGFAAQGLEAEGKGPGKRDLHVGIRGASGISTENVTPKTELPRGYLSQDSCLNQRGN